MRASSWLIFVALAGLTATALAAEVEQPAEGKEPAYCLAGNSFDILTVLPPPPREGSPRGIADRQVFRQTRALKGTPRWTLATNDIALAPADLMRDFSCAVGISLTPETAPMTATLLTRASSDTARMTGIAKTRYKRQRPYLIDPGPICQPESELKGSYDYPSGHTTAGWTWAVLLAEIVPDRAAEILARGRAYGESRIVCGVHSASAVEAGRLSASATLAAIAEQPGFRSDLSAARREMDALRTAGSTPRPDARQCAAERSLIAQPVY